MQILSSVNQADDINVRGGDEQMGQYPEGFYFDDPDEIHYDDFSDIEEAGRKSQECSDYMQESDNPYPLCDNPVCELRSVCCVSKYMSETPYREDE